MAMSVGLTKRWSHESVRCVRIGRPWPDLSIQRSCELCYRMTHVVSKVYCVLYYINKIMMMTTTEKLCQWLATLFLAHSRPIIFQVTLARVFPSCIRSSHLPFPWYIRPQHFPQYVFFVSPHHTPIPVQSSLRDLFGSLHHSCCTFVPHLFFSCHSTRLVGSHYLRASWNTGPIALWCMPGIFLGIIRYGPMSLKFDGPFL